MTPGFLRFFRSIRFSRPILNSVLLVIAILLLATASPTLRADTPATAYHTNPLNLDPVVRDGFQRFYLLDYDGALSRFESVLAAHPQDPMASGYVLMDLVFRELYIQDLLDTTYYAHDSFLTSRRNVSVAPATRERIESLTNTVNSICEKRIKANPSDKDAYFARGYARGMHAVFITLVDHSYAAAARQGFASRSDSEQALRIDPGYVDARMAVGIQQFAVASLPRWIRIVVGIAGVSGNREKGLNMLRDCAAHGTITSIESRTVLALFLRHDARYAEAITVQHGLAVEYPHDYLFRLEEANLTKDSGNGPGASAMYRAVLADAAKPGYFVDPRLQLAWFGLADTERGQNDIQSAAQHYLEAASQPKCSDWLRRRAQLNAGQMFDLLHQRDVAVRQYELASAGGGDQSQADAARRFLKTPYTGK
jgi:tetratricopeptide (TPR) repeat protein